MQQLSLDLGILPENPINSTYDPHWDEITFDDEGVGGQPLNLESQIENNFSVGDEESKLSKLSKSSKLNSCSPTIQVGDAIIDDGGMVSQWITEPQQLSGFESVSGQFENLDGERLLQPHKSVSGQSEARYKSVSGQVTNETAHQLVFTDKAVSGQVNNHTNGSAHQPNGWIEKYSVPRNGHKYYYWRFAWREGTRKRRRYIGSCTNPKVKERVQVVTSAIASGKLPHEIIGLI